MSKNLTWDFTWIESQQKLEEIMPQLLKEERVSLDTETWGWETGNEKLCLLQFGLPSKEHVFIVDALALSNFKALEPILSNATPEIICHNASFEVRQLERHGIKIRGIIDTLSLARTLRPELPNHTLRTCCKFLLGLEISKVEQRSDWSLRPLSSEQIEYAALDAEVTVRLFNILAAMQDKLVLDPKISIGEMMGQLATTIKERYALTWEIANDLALLYAREQMLRDAIRDKLVNGEPSYDGPYGKADISKVKKTEVNVGKVRSQLPEIADLVIRESVERKHLLAVMKEHNISEDKLSDVLDIVGYSDRINLTVGEID